MRKKNGLGDQNNDLILEGTKVELLRNWRFIKDLRKKKMHQPGVEPGSAAWKAAILPLDH